MAFGQKSIIGSLEFKRNLDGFFGGLPTARNLWRKSLMKYGLWPEINHHRNLDGIQTEIKSLTKILDQNALEYLASGKGFILDRLTSRHLNENLKNNLQLESFPCVPWIFWGLLRKMFWSSEDIVRARFHYAESQQK